MMTCSRAERDTQAVVEAVETLLTLAASATGRTQGRCGEGEHAGVDQSGQAERRDQ
ncbi:hypothetical protein [Streptomyces sp. NPDC046870]|uniref:hypothetical protein n=1 Tax=Streptomyces sp. NPDC046870 TaxID=3155135 RepID=UPI00345470EC